MIKNFIINALAVGIVFYILPSIDVMGDTYLQKGINVLIVAIIIGALNLIVKPIITLVTLPINLITLGLFSIVINALMIKLADMILTSFNINGFWNYIFFAVLLSLVHIGLNLFKSKEE